MKKNFRWILPILAVVVVAAIALVVFFIAFAPSEETQVTEPAESVQATEPTGIAIEQPFSRRIYWNIERDSYLNEYRESTRIRSGKYYRVRYAVDGEQIDLFYEDKDLLNQAENLWFTSLVVNEDNVVTQVVPVENFCLGTAAIDFYVESFTQDRIVCSQSADYDGPGVTYRYNESTVIYDVTDGSLLCGIPGQLEVDCTIWAIMGNDGYLSHIFVKKPFVQKPVYWNTKRMYDSVTKLSTRETDARGFYVFSFIVDGQPIERKTRELEIASKVDAIAPRCMSLTLDENGDIADAEGAHVATGGKSLASWYHIMELRENGFYAEKFSGSDKGKTAVGTYAKNVKIYDMSDSAKVLGEETELRLYDQVHCLRNTMGQVCVVFIVSRNVQAEIYWNCERQYDSVAKSTKRVPAADGYYYIEFATGGQKVTLRTKDKAVVDQIDSLATRTMALEVAGDEILHFYKYNTLFSYSGGSVGGWFTVTSVNGESIKLQNKNKSDSTYGKTESITVPEGTPIYNVSNNYQSFMGEATNIRVGDKLFSLLNKDGEVAYVLVVSRPVMSGVYFNYDRQYNASANTTKRTPAEDGYYYIEFVVDGTTKVLKTDSKKIVDEIDGNSSRAMGFKLKGDRILKVYKYTEVYGYAGSVGGSWTVTAFDGKTVELTNEISSSADFGKVVSYAYTKDTPVYNATTNFLDHLGEATQIRVGDKLFSIKDDDGDVSLVFVVARPVVIDSPVYFNYDRQEDAKTGGTKRVPAEDGWYYITFVVEGNSKVLKTDSKEIADEIDANSSRAMAFELQDDRILKVYKYTELKGYVGSVGGSWTVTAFDGKTVELTNEISSSADLGKVVSYELPEGAPIYNATTDYLYHLGEPTNIRVGDKLFSILGSDGQVALVFVVSKVVVSDIYWNMTRCYDAEKLVTTRTPDADGWYSIEFAVNGGLVTLKTQSKDVATQVDSYPGRCMGLGIDGDEIRKVYKAIDVQGHTGGAFISWGMVTQVTQEGTVTAVKDGETKQAQVAEGFRVFDVTDLGKEVTLAPGDTIHALRNGNGQVSVAFVVGRSVYAHCQACDAMVTWKAWDGKTSPTENTHLILKDDITKASMLNLKADVKVCLDLNGRNITVGENTSRAFNIYGTLNLMGEGTVTATNPNTKMAPVFYVQTGGTMRMYGGTLTSGVPSPRAGIGIVQGTMELYDGTITGGESLADGGNIEMLSGSFVMYGGTVSNGNAVNRGGNICAAYESCTVKLLGGTVTGGTGGIYTECNVILGGDITVTGNDGYNLYLTGGKLLQLESALTAPKAVGITGSGVISGQVPEGTDAYFFSDSNDALIRAEDGTLQLLHIHSLTENGQPVQWKAYRSDWVSGEYYCLTQDLTDWKTLTIPAGSTLNLCLNGYDITGAASASRMFRIYGTLNLCDHKHEDEFRGDVISTYAGTDTSMAHVFYVFQDGEFNLYGGNLIATGKAAEACVGVVRNAEMTIYDGKIHGGTLWENSKKNGGNLGIFDAAVLTVHGGEISGGVSHNLGGNIYVNSAQGQLIMDGGLITGGTAPGGGAGVWSLSDVKLGGDARICANNHTDLGLASGRKVIVTAKLTNENAIGITLKDTAGVFTNQVDEETIKAFFSNKGLKLFQNKDGCLELTEELYV